MVSSGSAIKRTVPIWTDTPEKITNIYQELHASGKFVIPTGSQDTNLVDKSGLITVTTRALSITRLEYASIANLELFKRELETARQEGHYHVKRETYMSEDVRDTIEDAVQRAHDEQAYTAFQQGKSFPQYMKYE
jgi:predicted molibdopterin-dependent oxidoreductase YjgC